MAASSYYLSDGKETTGPFPLEELQRRQAAGELPMGALIHDGQNWVSAAEFLRGMAIAANPDLALAQALLLEKKPGGKEDAARWESLLFVLSFPVLIPSLLLMRLMAKRWGHVDIYLILGDGIILMWLGFLSSPWFGGVMMISWLASVFLYWLRRDRQGHGIFLGYSNLVCWLLMAGGALAIGGFYAVFPWQPYARLRAIQKSPIVVNVAQTENQAVGPERTLVLQDEKLDFDNALLRQKINGEWKFILKRNANGATYDREHVRAVWLNFDKLAGHEAVLTKVALTKVALTGFASVRDRVEVADGPGKRILEIPRHHFALVSDSDARLWVVSAEPIAAGADVRGVVRTITIDAASMAAFTAAKLGNLRAPGVAIFADERAPAPKPEAQETWVPVKNSKGSFWIRFPDGVEPPADAAAAGIYVGGIQEHPGLVDFSADMFRRTDARVLLQEPPATYLAEQKILALIWAGTEWEKSVWFAAGVVLLGLASWRARLE